MTNFDECGITSVVAKSRKKRNFQVKKINAWKNHQSHLSVWKLTKNKEKNKQIPGYCLRNDDGRVNDDKLQRVTPMLLSEIIRVLHP